MKKIIILFSFCLFLTSMLLAQNALSEGVKVEVKNEKNINTAALEYSPAFYENGIVFISDNKIKDKNGLLDNKIQKHTMSIFLSRRNDEGELGEPQPFAEEITTQFHEGPLTFNKSNDKIFFSRNDYLDGKTEKASNGVVKQIILSAEMAGGEWMNLEELPFNDKEHDYVHPSINVDDNVLYFASDRPGGYGGFDLWKVEKNGVEWGEPINLGSGVNTSSNEVFPFIHADGTLFFSSNGHNGTGGGDIFFSKEYNGQFVQPVNLGPKFNTDADDFGFIIDRDKRNGYFSSDRNGGKGQDDIYSFFIDEELGEDIFMFPEDHPAMIASNGAINKNGNGVDNGDTNANGFGNQIINLFVADRVTGAEIDGATVEYVDLELLTKTEIVTDQNGNIIQLISSENGQAVTLSSEEKAIQGLTDQEGSYVIKIGDGNYLVNISKDGYKPKQVLVSAADIQEEFMVLLDRAGDCATVQGMVISDSNNPVSSAQITVQEKGGSGQQEVITDASGNFTLCLDCAKTYIITANKNGKATSREIVIPADCNNGQIQQISLNLSGGGLAGGTTIRLKRIYYNFNDASIRPDARIELNALADLLQSYPTLEIEIASHTDSRGTNAYNNNLSQRRADKVVAYLVQRGISASRLYPVGYGERELLNECTDGTSCSELDHQYNRRTEVRVKELVNPVGVEYVANPPESVDSAPSSVLTGGSSSSTYNSGSGEYQVIAGSFANPNNADNRLSRVQQLGFSDAQIVQGTGVARNVVLIKTFSNYNQARTLADEIENVHNINTYVKRNF